MAGEPRPLLFSFGSGWEQRQADVAAGRAPAESHGFFALRDRGVDVLGVDLDVARREPRWTLGLLFERRFVIPRSGMGFRISQALGVRRLLRGDPHRCVVAGADSIALPLLRLKAAGLLPNPVVHLSIGFADRLARGEIHPDLEGRYRGLFRGADAVLTFTPREAEELERWAPGLGPEVLPLGVDVGWWGGGTAPEPRWDVFSGGRDPGRDFGTLAAAVAARDGTRALVVGTLARQQGVVSAGGLTVEDDVPIARFRDELRAARVVVVPSRAALHGAGQTTALHALAAGRPLVMTDSGWARGQGLVAGRHFVHVPPGDPRALREAIDGLLAAPDRCAELAREGVETVRARASTTVQADALAAIVAARVG